MQMSNTKPTDPAEQLGPIHVVAVAAMFMPFWLFPLFSLMAWIF